MLPIYLLTAAKGQPTLVELKSGETINGTLVEVDTLMNVTLINVIETSQDGESFLKLPEIFIRGKDIKYIRLPEEIIGEVKARNVQNQEQRQRNRGNNNNNNNGYNNDRRGNNRNYNNQGNRNFNNNGGRNNNNNSNNRGNRRQNNQDHDNNQRQHQQAAQS